MPQQDGKDVAGRAGDVGPVEGTACASETLGEVLSKAGFEPAKIGRKIVSQGRRRESLKKQTYKKPA